MATEDLILRLVGWLTFMSSAIVGVAAFRFYLLRPLRSVLWVAISGGLGAVIALIYWMAETSSPTFWMVINLASAFDLSFWALAMCLLFRDLARQDREPS